MVKRGFKNKFFSSSSGLGGFKSFKEPSNFSAATGQEALALPSLQSAQIGCAEHTGSICPRFLPLPSVSASVSKCCLRYFSCSGVWGRELHCGRFSSGSSTSLSEPDKSSSARIEPERKATMMDVSTRQFLF